MHQTLLVIRKGQKQSVHTERLHDGTAGNLRTLVFVRQMVREDSALNIELRQRAQEIIADCAPRDFDCEVEKLFEYAQNIRFVRDPIDVERIADAATTMAEGQGDCVDKSILLASLLGSVGYLTRGECVNFAGDVESRGFDHFYLEVQRPDGSWQALDPTPENVEPGWEVGAQVHRNVEFWDGTGGESGLSGLLDQILPGLIQQGVQIGAQFAASAQQQSRLSESQSRQIGHQFDQLAGQVTGIFDQIQRQPTITAENVNVVYQAYQQLAAVAQQYSGVPYVVQQWNSAAYKPAYEARLRDLAARVVGPTGAPSPSGSATQPPAQQTTLPTTSNGVISGLTSNPLFLPLVILIAVMVIRR